MLANLKIVCQFHAHSVHQNSVEIFWAEIYRGRLLPLITGSSSRLLRIRFSADLSMYWFPLCHFWLCPVSSSLPLRVHKVYIWVSFSDTFLRWLPPFVTAIAVIISREKNFPFYTLLGSGCVLISYSMLSLIIA
jgi:hypothetical protein